MKSEQAAPLGIGIDGYGLNAGFGLNSGTSGWVGLQTITNRSHERRTFGFRLTGGEMPWRFGLTRYKMPRAEAKTVVRVDTVRGIDLTLRSKDPQFRIGYSRSTFTGGESTNGVIRVFYQTGRLVPMIEISEEPNE